MGTWDSGPFDNDAASDWASDLQDASPENRAAVVRSALTLEEGYLDVDDGQAAVAAVAVVAVISGTAVQPADWPDFLAGSDTLHLPDDLRDMAVTALDRVTDEDSELHGLWTDSGSNDDWDAQIVKALAVVHHGSPVARCRWSRLARPSRGGARSAGVHPGRRPTMTNWTATRGCGTARSRVGRRGRRRIQPSR